MCSTYEDLLGVVTFVQETRSKMLMIGSWRLLGLPTLQWLRFMSLDVRCTFRFTCDFSKELSNLDRRVYKKPFSRQSNMSSYGVAEMVNAKLQLERQLRTYSPRSVEAPAPVRDRTHDHISFSDLNK